MDRLDIGPVFYRREQKSSDDTKGITVDHFMGVPDQGRQPVQFPRCAEHGKCHPHKCSEDRKDRGANEKRAKAQVQ